MLCIVLWQQQDRFILHSARRPVMHLYPPPPPKKKPTETAGGRDDIYFEKVQWIHTVEVITIVSGYIEVSTLLQTMLETRQVKGDTRITS